MTRVRRLRLPGVPPGVCGWSEVITEFRPKGRVVGAARKRRQGHEEARRRENEARPGEAHGRMEQTRGEAHTAYSSHAEEKRMQSERTTTDLLLGR